VLPFNITLAGANEYGAMCASKILGVEILNEGSGISVDDAVTEFQATFVARAIEPLQAVNSPLDQVSSSCRTNNPSRAQIPELVVVCCFLCFQPADVTGTSAQETTPTPGVRSGIVLLQPCYRGIWEIRVLSRIYPAGKAICFCAAGRLPSPAYPLDCLPSRPSRF
jgi:hypothetical protein